MQLEAKTKSTKSSCKQPHPGSQTHVGLLMPTHIIFYDAVLWLDDYETISGLTTVKYPEQGQEEAGLQTNR